MAIRIEIRGGGLPGLGKYAEGILKAKSSGVRVGVLEGATYGEGPLAGEPVAQNLARHEFGTTSIPARAPFRKTIENKKKAWAKEFSDYLGAAAGVIDVRAALTRVGDVMAMDIQQSFEDGLEPGLKASTIEQKKRITREGTKTGKYKKGKKAGQRKEGDYAVNAAKPVVLTGTAQRSIQSEYLDDLSLVGGGS